MAAVVGALRVELGLNSAQFTEGLKRAQSGLTRFGKQAAVGLAVVSAAATAAGIALGVAVKGAIDHADELSKTAQKAGLTVEALSRLEYAAKLSDVSLEGLSGGLRKLSQNMLAVAEGSKGPAATSFKALGISVTDAQGRLRSTDVVLAELADRFERMQDGPQKTAIAMNLLGRAGADLIPLLNSGKQGLADMADESDRLGNTISTKTGRQAEEFNDTITRLQSAFGGIVNKITAAVLPAFQSIADTISSPEFQAAIVNVATWVTNLLDGILKFAVGVKKAIDYVLTLRPRSQAIDKLRVPLAKMAEPNHRDYSEFYEKRLDEIYGPLGGDKINLLSPIPGLPNAGSSGGTPFAPVIADLGAAKDAAKAFKAEVAGWDRSFDRAATAWAKVMEPIEDSMNAIGDGISNAMGGLISDVIKGKDAVGGLLDSFGQLGDRLIQMALDQAIQGLLGSIMGAFSVGGVGGFKGLPGLGGFTGKLVSLDGGGFTGYGARAGGLDGRGGFPALLHPNETVIDHTKGQSSGPLAVFHITGSAQDAAAIANTAAEVFEQKFGPRMRQYQQRGY